MSEAAREQMISLVVGLSVLVGLIIAAVLVESIFFDKPSAKNQTKQIESTGDGEYQDAMESKNYSPDGEGSEQCWGAICN